MNAAPTRSDVRDAQIRYAVRYGRKCTFYPIDNTEVTGYVGAVDGECYLVLTVQDGTVVHRLIHTSCPVIELHPEATLDTESADVKKKLLEIVSPTRKWFERQTRNPRTEKQSP